MRNLEKITNVLGHENTTLGDAEVVLNTEENVTSDQLVKGAIAVVSVDYSDAKVKLAHQYTEGLTKRGSGVYGMTTSFGGNIKYAISPEQTDELQRNLVISHTANVGSCFPYEICRAAVALRLMTVSKGYSGVSPAVVELMNKMLKVGVVPAIPAHGSMGASGDLNPLSAAAYVLIGKGHVYMPDRKTIVPTSEAFAKHDLASIELSHRDGLALINSTSVMTSLGSFYLHYSRRLIANSLVTGAMMIEAMGGSKEPFDPRLHALKPHKYQVRVAEVLHNILQSSKLAKSHNDLKSTVEHELGENGDSDVVKVDVDLQGGSYSLRAIPQIYQPILALFNLFQESVNMEINAVDDNPALLVDEDLQLHGANFHGYPISLTADALNASIISIANIANSRVDRILKSHLSNLPAFLSTGQPGLHLGLQGAQYTAAGITSEMRALAFPLSVNQITTNNDNQDFVSFGMQATAKGMELSVLLSYVLAVEYIAAAQGIWLRIKNDGYDLDDLSSVTRSAYEKLLKIYEPIANEDQSFTEAIESVSQLLLTESILPSELEQELFD